jgi:hypothetical protein
MPTVCQVFVFWLGDRNMGEREKERQRVGIRTEFGTKMKILSISSVETKVPIEKRFTAVNAKSLTLSNTLAYPVKE